MKESWNPFFRWKGWKIPFPLPVRESAVCLLTVAMGIYMIRRANREINTLQEKKHGE